MTHSIGLPKFSVQTNSCALWRRSEELFSPCWLVFAEPAHNTRHRTEARRLVHSSSGTRPVLHSSESHYYRYRYNPCIIVEEPSIYKETMVFSVSRQHATELAVLVSFAAFTVCCAGFFQRNETGMAEQETGMETISSK